MQTISRAVQEIVTERSGGTCEITLPGCTGQATQMHHRRRKGMGGDPRPETNLAGNLLHTCYACHQTVESRRTMARCNGHLVRDNDLPEREKVAYRGVLGCYLHNDGTITYPEGMAPLW